MHCKATLFFFQTRFEIYNNLLDGILWKIFCETMDKSKIRAIYAYEFRCETNKSETACKINSVLGEGSTSHSIVSFSYARLKLFVS